MRGARQLLRVEAKDRRLIGPRSVFIHQTSRTTRISDCFERYTFKVVSSINMSARSLSRPSPGPIFNLPAEVLGLIFSNLSIQIIQAQCLVSVCKLWHRTAWRGVTSLDLSRIPITSRFISTLPQRTPHLRCLSLCNTYNLTDDILKNDIARLTLLQDLDIAHTSVSFGGVNALSSLTSLRSLNLSTYLAINADTISHLTTLNRLTALNLGLIGISVSSDFLGATSFSAPLISSLRLITLCFCLSSFLYIHRRLV